MRQPSRRVERSAADVPRNLLHMRKYVSRVSEPRSTPAFANREWNDEEKNDQAARAISIGQLNALRRLHLRPIDVVVFDGSSGGCPREA